MSHNRLRSIALLVLAALALVGCPHGSKVRTWHYRYRVGQPEPVLMDAQPRPNLPERGQ